MNNLINNDDLVSRKSLLIIQAQFQQAVGQSAEAVRHFLEAALLEERIANNFRQTGNADDAAISLFSAASCYKQAGDVAKAIALTDEAMKLTQSENFLAEMLDFRSECEQALHSTGQRTLRGIVRNGAVYPFEPGVLAEGQLVTITAA